MEEHSKVLAAKHNYLLNLSLARNYAKQLDESNLHLYQTRDDWDDTLNMASSYVHQAVNALLSALEVLEQGS